LKVSFISIIQGYSLFFHNDTLPLCHLSIKSNVTEY